MIWGGLALPHEVTDCPCKTELISSLLTSYLPFVLSFLTTFLLLALFSTWASMYPNSKINERVWQEILLLRRQRQTDLWVWGQLPGIHRENCLERQKQTNKRDTKIYLFLKTWVLSFCSLDIYQCSCFLSVNFASENWMKHLTVMKYFLILFYFRKNTFIGPMLLCSLTKLYLKRGRSENRVREGKPQFLFIGWHVFWYWYGWTGTAIPVF